MVSPHNSLIHHSNRVGLALAAALVLGLGGCSDKSDGGSGSDGADDGADGSGDDGGDDGGDGGDDGGNDSSGGGDGGSDGDAGDDGSGGTSGDDGAGFIDPPDGGVVGQCDPGLQDCPNPDEKCTTYATMPGACCVDSSKCVPVIGSKVAGDMCERTADNDDCDAGYFCTTKTSGATGMGVCEEFCVAGDPDSCMDGGDCIVYNDGVHPLCRASCDPLLQDCPQNLGCYPGTDTFVCGPPAIDTGEGQEGQECYTGRSCERGLVCVDASISEGCAAGSRCCTAFCDLSMGDTMNPTCTEATEQCVTWFEMGMAPPQYENVGACTIPP